MSLRTCAQCARDWISRRPDAKLCSDACRSVYYQAQRYGTGPRPSRVSILPADHPVIWYGRTSAISFIHCAECATLVTQHRRGRIYCSTRCKVRAKQRRRNLAHGLFDISRADRLAIYERDGWLCQLCLDPVDRTLHYQDDWAASLDHIEPRSTAAVPDHSPSNLRLAHRWCNAVRGDGSRDVLDELFAA